MNEPSNRAARERLVGDALDLGRFCAPQGVALRIDHAPAEDWPWEFFQGHLLNARQTRERRTFESWRLCLAHGDAPSAPRISLLFDSALDRWHVLRHLLCYLWEPFESSPGVIESRETQAWATEWVGSLEASPADPADLRRLIGLAVWGTSRLPITSLESPLPEFSLGQLDYDPDEPCPTEIPPARGPEPTCAMGSFPAREPHRAALPRLASALEGVPAREPQRPARLLETALRSQENVPLSDLAACLANRWPDPHAAHAGHVSGEAVFRALFQSVALAPHTSFAERMVGLLGTLAARPAWRAAVLDLQAYMLRHLVRHLSAFDLLTFHNQGANYPDALLLEQLLAALLAEAAAAPEQFLPQADDPPATERARRLRRRGLRQALTLRRLYEGHRVPDAPTSTGENQRVLPAPFVRVPEEQLPRGGRRRKALFPTKTANLIPQSALPVVLAAVADLALREELLELGRASFLDRPLGFFKLPGEVDRTPLLSYQAASKQLVAARLDDLHRLGWLEPAARDSLRQRLADLDIRGIAARCYTNRARPGVVGLEDARQAAEDFWFERSTESSLALLRAEVGGDWPQVPIRLAIRLPEADPARPERPFLGLYGAGLELHGTVRLAAPPDGAGVAYVERQGRERLAGGLRFEG